MLRLAEVPVEKIIFICYFTDIHKLFFFQICMVTVVPPLNSLCRRCAIIATTESHRGPRGWGCGTVERALLVFSNGCGCQGNFIESLSGCVEAWYGFWALAVKARSQMTSLPSSPGYSLVIFIINFLSYF